MSDKRFNIRQVLVGIAVVSLAAIVLWFFVYALRPVRNAGRMPDSSNLRSIIQGMSIYANDHNGDSLPGLAGEENALSVQHRYQILLEGDYIDPDVLIHSHERDTKELWRGAQQDGPLTVDYYSYAMLQVPQAGGRRKEWHFNMNSRAVLVSDRNLGSSENPASLWNAEKWEGVTGWGDAHAMFETDPMMETRYGEARNKEDHLFRTDGPDDAWMIYTGNGAN